MRRALWLLLWWWLSSVSWAYTTHQLGSLGDELAAQFGDQLPGYVASGCLHGTSGTTAVTMPPCAGYVLVPGAGGVNPALVYVHDDTPRSWSYSAGDGDYWIFLHPQVAPDVAGCTRVDGTHYVWCHVAPGAVPPRPEGTLRLQSATVAGGQVTAIIDRRVRRMTQDETITTSHTTGPFAQWIWDGPGAVITVAPGQVLNFGSCPQAGPFPIFNADSVTTGRVDFLRGGCNKVYPEWWGIDPHGQVANIHLWNAVMEATKNRAIIDCAGEYRFEAPNAGDVGLLLQDGTQIVGTYRRGNPVPSDPTPCRLVTYGKGNGVGVPHTMVSKFNLYLENVSIEFEGEPSLTNIGLDLYFPQSMSMRNVFIRAFGTGIQVIGNTYYGRWEQVKVRSYRTRCMDVSGGSANGVQIEIGCTDGGTGTALEGIRWGVMPGLYGTSNDVHLTAMVEQQTGLPVSLHRINGLAADLYVEMLTDPARYQFGAGIILSRMVGGRLQVRMRASMPQPYIRGIWIADADSPGTRNLQILGMVDNYSFPVYVAPSPGTWGIDYSRLAVKRDDSPSQNPAGVLPRDFVTGSMIMNNYLTGGYGLPLVDEGRGSTAMGTTWEAGDVIMNSIAGRLSGILATVTLSGNPPGGLVGPNSVLVVPADEAQPTLQEGPRRYNVLSLLGTVGAVALTDILDGVQGQTLSLLTEGDRTIVHDATKLVLNPPSNYVMGPFDTLTLRRHGSVWVETGRSDKP